MIYMFFQKKEQNLLKKCLLKAILFAYASLQVNWKYFWLKNLFLKVYDKVFEIYLKVLVQPSVNDIDLAGFDINSNVLEGATCFQITKERYFLGIRA